MFVDQVRDLTKVRICERGLTLDETNRDRSAKLRRDRLKTQDAEAERLGQICFFSNQKRREAGCKKRAERRQQVDRGRGIRFLLSSSVRALVAVRLGIDWGLHRGAKRQGGRTEEETEGAGMMMGGKVLVNTRKGMEVAKVSGTRRREEGPEC